MTLLQLLQQFCAKWGLPGPSGVFASTDSTYTQLLALAKESVLELQDEGWTQTTSRVTFSMLGAEDQGTVAAVFGAGFKSLIPGTVWNSTQNVPIFGPVGDASWQLFKQFASNPWGQYKLMNGHFYILPAPTAGHSLTAMIHSKYIVSSALGVLKETYTADDDYLVVGDRVFLADLEWRWLKQKGEAWASAKDAARDAINAALVADGGLPTLSLDRGDGKGLRPGIVVPAGNWPV